MSNPKNWYALYTAAGGEKKVINALTKIGTEFYCPVSEVINKYRERKKRVIRAVFPSIIFVRTTAENLRFFRQLTGVINIMHWLREPAVIKDIEIEMLRQFLIEHQHVTVQKTKVNCVAMIPSFNGELAGPGDESASVNGHRNNLMLPSLGYCLVAEVATIQLEPGNKIFNFPVDMASKLRLG